MARAMTFCEIPIGLFRYSSLFRISSGCIPLSLSAIQVGAK